MKLPKLYSEDKYAKQCCTLTQSMYQSGWNSAIREVIKLNPKEFVGTVCYGADLVEIIEESK